MSEPQRFDAGEGEPQESNQASGHQHAIQTLATVRQKALNAVVSINSAPNTSQSPFLNRNDRRSELHARANAIVTAYANLVTKPRWIDRHEASEFLETPFTTTPVPKSIVDTDTDYEVVRVQRMANDSVDDYLDQIELAQQNLSLTGIANFSNLTATIAKVPASPYESHRQPEFVSRKLVLPPRVLEDVYYRTDALADYFGFLLEMEDTGVEVESDYAYVKDVDKQFEEEYGDEIEI